jgi:hypothetical protein
MDNEAEQMMEEAAALQDDGEEEQAEDAALLQAEIWVQCRGCLEKGRQTPLSLKVTQESQYEDLVVECPVCTQEQGRRVVIPVIVLCGADAEEVGDLIANVASSQSAAYEEGEAVDDAHPFEAGSVKEASRPGATDTTDDEKRAYEELELATRPS